MKIKRNKIGDKKKILEKEKLRQKYLKTIQNREDIIIYILQKIDSLEKKINILNPKQGEIK